MTAEAYYQHDIATCKVFELHVHTAAVHVLLPAQAAISISPPDLMTSSTE